MNVWSLPENERAEVFNFDDEDEHDRGEELEFKIVTLRFYGYDTAGAGICKLFFGYFPFTFIWLIF